jgi:hypothetical protein
VGHVATLGREKSLDEGARIDICQNCKNVIQLAIRDRSKRRTALECRYRLVKPGVQALHIPGEDNFQGISYFEQTFRGLNMLVVRLIAGLPPSRYGASRGSQGASNFRIRKFKSALCPL